MGIDELRDALAVDASDEQLVYAWRCQVAEDAGVRPFEAELFAASEADLGVFRRLLEQGCPPAVAVRILT